MKTWHFFDKAHSSLDPPTWSAARTKRWRVSQKTFYYPNGIVGSLECSLLTGEGNSKEASDGR